MVSCDDPRRPHWQAELVRLHGERRCLASAIGWAQRAGQPRQVTSLQRGAARRRRRITHPRELRGLPASQE